MTYIDQFIRRWWRSAKLGAVILVVLVLGYLIWEAV